MHQPAFLPSVPFSFSFKAPLVDSSDGGHSSTAVIMLVSVVLMGLAVFVIYKFKRYSTLG